MPVSVIIPTWNEAHDLPRTLQAVFAGFPPPAEIIVVDAGSGDGTLDRAAAFSAVRIVPSPVRQRAAQMNLGAVRARTDILYFLHADTCIPTGTFAAIERAVARGAAGGGFIRRFDSPSWILAATSRLADWRCRLWGWFLGDQSIFVARDVFRRLGGFRDVDRFEDLDFSRRLSRIAKTVTLTPPVVTSARRFSAKGPLRQTWLDLRLTLDYLRGNKAAVTVFPTETPDHDDQKGERHNL